VTRSPKPSNKPKWKGISLIVNRVTQYPEINKILDLLLSSASAVLGNQLVGMYLYGSLATGDFDLETSDIDFLVVTTSSLSDKTIADLEAMHHRLWKSGLKWAAKLEGSYIPKRDIRRHDPRSGPCPTVNEGQFYLDQRGSDWIIQRHVIREQGIILVGPPPETLIDPVSPNEIRKAIKGVLQEWWFPMLENPSWLQKHGVGYHAYAILTMCRALHALEHGMIVSKPEAARWAQKELGEEWSLVIEQALATRADMQGFELYSSALDLIRFAKNRVAQLKI
jgi:predicted nucleotidyltransferase